MRRITIEEYIETIYALEKREGAAHTGSIASEMGVKPPSVTEMLQKLERSGLVKYKPFGGATLTNAGRKKARELMNRHRVIADFIEILGVKREQAELDACQMEHHVSSETVEKLERFVEFVHNAPADPKWIGHFQHFCETGERICCEECRIGKEAKCVPYNDDE